MSRCPRRLREVLCVATSILVLGSCSTSGPETTLVYDAYEGGPVYPNQRPKLTLPEGDVGLTSDNGSDTVTVIDLGAQSIVGSAPVGRSPVDNDGPHHIAADRAAGFAYVALSYPAPAIAPGPHAAHGSSTRSGFVQKLALDDLRIVGEVRVETNPGDIVLAEDGSRLVVSHFDLAKAVMPTPDVDARRATLMVLEPTRILASGSADPVAITTCIAPHGVALSRPKGKTAFVACYGEDAIAVVDLENPAATPLRVPVGPGAATSGGAPTYGPYAAVLSPDGALVAVSSTEAKDVRFFDTASSAMSAVVIATLGAPYFPAWSADGARLIVPTQVPDSVVVAEVATGNTLTSRSFAPGECTLPHEVTSATDGTMLYVVCEGDHLTPSVVLALDPITLETRASLHVGVYPDRLHVMGAR